MSPVNQGVLSPNDMHMEQEGEDEHFPRLHLGKVPLMVRSNYCALHAMPEAHVISIGECQFDQVLLLLSSSFI